MEQRCIPEKTNEFNLRLEDESGENWRNAEGVMSVELPKLAFDGDGNLLGITPVRIFFTTVETALAVFKAKETHLCVRAAEQLRDKEGGYCFKGRQHILTVKRPAMKFSAGVTTRGEPACALCEFAVKEYAMVFDGEEIFYVSTEGKMLGIN